MLYLGVSDMAAWQIARMNTMADANGWSPFVALQIEYSLAQRTVEAELIPMARALNLGVLPWSPLAGGVLTGKYTRDDLKKASAADGAASGRLAIAVDHAMVNEKTLATADIVKAVAREIGASPAQVALAWTLTNDTVVAPIIGARTLEQFEDNLGALAIELTPEHAKRLDDASRVPMAFPQVLEIAYGAELLEQRNRRRNASAMITQRKGAPEAQPPSKAPSAALAVTRTVGPGEGSRGGAQKPHASTAGLQ